MVRPKKFLGQHFLNDENIARKIIGYLPAGYSNVVEVGAGMGVLSKYLLADDSLNPLFFEVDYESIKYLKVHYPEIQAKLIEVDFLRYDLSQIPAPFIICGNFPYNISTQILFRVLSCRNQVPFLLGMFQKEVAERIASPPGSKKYGILSVLLKAWYDIEYLFTVNESVFYPPPKVKSAVICLRRNETGQIGCNEELFFKVVKTAFNQRRKVLRNALKMMVPAETSLPASQDSRRLESLLANRAEQLSVEDFVFLTNWIAACP
ncbi:MAG: 16S rRNA (adenine(1518)-N(6)/adenine(1519)-N(6))-dimethyltransferase RsmA [Bacteroidetes bacterium]|nr:16S rRNA (adenine(1518)-N(6)/adenine(1519)-N(6))-dimethyltransferase RsmA [Bacteroidota bacterium]